MPGLLRGVARTAVVARPGEKRQVYDQVNELTQLIKTGT